MHYNIFFNGCSYTEGGELEGINKDLEHRRSHRFSHLIGEKTGLTYCNISRSGYCNNDILRTTVKWFEEGNTCDHAIIQWTFRNRVEYFSEKILYKPKELDPEDFNNIAKYHSIYPHVQRFNQLGNSILQSIINIQNNSNDQNNEDHCMYFMKNLLKDKCSFDYLKLKKESKVVSDYYELSPYHKYLADVSITYIDSDILKNSKIFNCRKIPGYEHLTGGHPNELGHRKIAEYIINNFDYFQ